jgi:hypothetical protein
MLPHFSSLLEYWGVEHIAFAFAYLGGFQTRPYLIFYFQSRGRCYVYFDIFIN